MALKVYRPMNPGLRRTSVVRDAMLSKGRPLKALTISQKQHSGRNAQGKITVRHRGGGAYRHIRVVDFRRDKFEVPAVVKTLEYDPNRNAYIAQLIYRDGEKRYSIAPHGLTVGTTIISSMKPGEVKIGNQFKLKHIPTGLEIYNIELAPGKGAQMCRAAGNYATLMSIDGGKANLKLPSGEVRVVSEECMATIGVASNPEHRNIRWGKAGRMRHRGIRPTVRGKAMNPVDHPHGGGEGKHPIGMKHPKTYRGKPALGVKTRSGNKASNAAIISRRKGKRL